MKLLKLKSLDEINEESKLNEYVISFSLFSLDNFKTHFSNCRTTIKGENFENALRVFKQKNFREGWIVDFIVQGEMFKIKYVIKKEK